MVDANEGKRAISQIEVVTCANCGAAVKCEDGKPVATCCGDFQRS